MACIFIRKKTLEELEELLFLAVYRQKKYLWDIGVIISNYILSLSYFKFNFLHFYTSIHYMLNIFLPMLFHTPFPTF